MIRQIRLIATVAAAATTATATSETISGKILKVDFDVTGDSMDIDIDSVGEATAQKILNITGNTDSTVYPEVERTDNAAVSLDASDAQGGPVKKFGPYVVFGKLKLSLASAAAAETVTATITYED